MYLFVLDAHACCPPKGEANDRQRLNCTYDYDEQQGMG